MKKQLFANGRILAKTGLFCSSVFIALTAAAQNSIPNGNFENWTSDTYEDPLYYPFTTNSDAFFYCQAPFNVVKTTDAYHGTYAIQLTTVMGAGGDTCIGAFLNVSSPDDSMPCQWLGGIAYNQMPTGISGRYKCAVMAGDTAFIFVAFRQGATCLGEYIYTFTGTQSAYALFSYTFNPPLVSAPDTIIFGAVSSNVINDSSIVIPGSMLQLDSISFTGAASQPALFNGSFELWQSQTLYSADDWNIQADWQSVNRTIDAAAGNYAIELTTYQGENNGVPRAQPGSISNGYWDNSCNCWKGGYPFSNQTDTLLFSYKYAPTTNDSAQVSLTFKKNGLQIYGVWKNLGPSASYQVVQVPFNVGQAPDTVIVQLQSSNWQDTLLSSLGDAFKADEIHFKSQPLNTGIQFQISNLKSQISIYPNPSSGKFTVSGLQFPVQITVYNLLGELIYNATANNKQETIDLSEAGSGSYLIQVNTKNGIYRGKLNKVE